MLLTSKSWVIILEPILSSLYCVEWCTFHGREINQSMPYVQMSDKNILLESDKLGLMDKLLPLAY
jgi:hypothetical protein